MASQRTNVDVEILPCSVTDQPLEGAATQQSDPIPSTSREVETVLSSQSPPGQPASTDGILPILRKLSPRLQQLVTPPVSPSILPETPDLPLTISEDDGAMPSTSFDTSHIVSTSSSNIQDTTMTPFNPYEVKPFPKAGPRKNNGKGKKGRKTAILTDTPNKLEIQEEERKMRAKIVKKPILQTKKSRAVLKKKKQKRKEEKRW